MSILFSTNYSDNSLYLLLEPVLSAVRMMGVQGKFYVGEVVVQMLEVVVVDTAEDLLLHLMSVRVEVVAGPQVVSGEMPFQI